MSVVVLHLSDMHFADEGNKIEGWEDRIASAVQLTIAEANTCVIAVTGDIAAAGKPTQYEIALRFLSRLKGLLKSQHSKLEVQFVAIPGNHDCDFGTEDDLRSMTLKTGAQIIDALSPNDESIVRALVGVQDAFFDFILKLEAMNDIATEHPTEHQSGYARLFYSRDLRVGEATIRFDCYNTAWMSQLHEKQGQLLFPVSLILENDNKYNAVVSMFHHPVQWLESNNARQFRTRIESMSDVVLTGHEHVADGYTKRKFSDEVTVYVEGAVLQEANTADSGFNVLSIDLGTRRKRLQEYAWQRDMYTVAKDSGWTAFERSRELRLLRFENNEAYLNILLDPGADFKHPSDIPLTLQDLFVYPDLEVIHFGKKTEEEAQVTPIIESDQVLDFVIDNSHLLITAPEIAGKTALARMLYQDLQRIGLVPVMLHGGDFRNPSFGDLSGNIDKHILDQYDSLSVERYGQLDRSKKVLIIDDFHRATRLSRRDQRTLLDSADRIFGRIIILANDIFRLEEFVQEVEEQSLLTSFRHSHIEPLGHWLRRRLISRWVQFGQPSADEEQLEHRIEETANIVSTLLGRKLVPSFPIFILSMLQVLEAKTDLNTASGAYGYFYEVFILQSLAANRIASIPMDSLTTYISLVAYHMYGLKRRYLTEDELDKVTERYFTEYGFKFKRDTMLDILAKSKVLYQDGSGAYRFKWRWLYYYFVAKYLAMSLNSVDRQEDTRRQIVRMAGNLYVEDFANIIIFLVYLTKDEETIGQILNIARSLYPEYPPCDFAQDVAFVNRIQSDPPLLDSPLASRKKTESVTSRRWTSLSVV